MEHTLIIGKRLHHRLKKLNLASKKKPSVGPMIHLHTKLVYNDFSRTSRESTRRDRNAEISQRKRAYMKPQNLSNPLLNEPWGVEEENR